MPGLELLVCILDHHDSRVDHRTDGNGDATERHDVGIDSLVVHDDEGHEHAHGERDDGNQGRAQVEQEQQAHQRDHRELLEQLAF